VCRTRLLHCIASSLLRLLILDQQNQITQPLTHVAYGFYKLLSPAFVRHLGELHVIALDLVEEFATRFPNQIELEVSQERNHIWDFIRAREGLPTRLGYNINRSWPIAFRSGCGRRQRQRR